MTKTRVPAIPAPTEANLREVARALKVLADIREGVTGDPLDRFVTFRDLDDGGVASVSLSGGRVSGIRPSAPIAGPGYDPTADLTTPPQPTGVTATGAFASVILSWDGLPAGYINHAYAEIWRADTNVVGDSVLIGTTLSTSFVDFIGNSATRYYWVRFVSQANVIGAYHDISGAVGTTSEDPELLLDALAGQITESQLFEDLGARINLIDEPETGLVAQVENVKGKYTVKIDNAGHVSGYGLASSPNDSTPTSEFGIRADKFWIAGASTASDTAPTTDLYKGLVWLDTSVTPAVTRYYTGSAWSTTPQTLPFSVLAAPGTINGVSVPAGVYIDTALIGAATIKAAQIGSLNADTIQAGYTTSVDLESSIFFGSELYIGGEATYEFNDTANPTRKTGIASVADPKIALKADGAEFDVGFFKIKNGASPVAPFEIVDNTVRIKTATIGNGSITNAKIGNAQIDTLKLSNNAVSVAAFFVGNTGALSVFPVEYCSSGYILLPAGFTITVSIRFYTELRFDAKFRCWSSGSIHLYKQVLGVDPPDQWTEIENDDVEMLRTQATGTNDTIYESTLPVVNIRTYTVANATENILAIRGGIQAYRVAGNSDDVIVKYSYGEIFGVFR